MPLKRTTRAEKIEQIQQAAFVFARVSRDANEIAAALRVSSRTVQRMIHLPLFQEELDRLEYQGKGVFANHIGHSAVPNLHGSQNIRK